MAGDIELLNLVDTVWLAVLSVGFYTFAKIYIFKKWFSSYLIYDYYEYAILFIIIIIILYIYI